MKTLLHSSLLLLTSSLFLYPLPSLSAKDAFDIRPEAETNAAPTGVEWENANDAALAEATADDVLAAFVADETAAKDLLSRLRGAYKTEPLVARQIAAVSQWVMTPEPCWICFWQPSPSAGRKIWIDALLTKAETSSDAYVKTFCLDQLRWCGCACPCVLDRIRVIGDKGGKGVKDFSDMVIRELRPK